MARKLIYPFPFGEMHYYLQPTLLIVFHPSLFLPPHKSYGKETPDLSIMSPWGCATYIHNTSHEYGKLVLRGKKCIFIRYSEFSIGYVFLGEDMTRRVTKIESRDVIFLE